MAERVSKKLVENVFARFCQTYGLPLATYGKGLKWTGFGLDYYHGYQIVEYKGSTAQYNPLGSRRYRASEFVDMLNFSIQLAYYLEHYAPTGAAQIRRNPSVTTFGNPRRRRGAGRYVAAEMRALRGGSRHVRSRRQAIAVGLAEARRAGVRVPMRQNPSRVAGTLSKRALEIRYVHATDGDKYVHKFRSGVTVQLLSDGSARLYRPDGRPLWRNFRD